MVAAERGDLVKAITFANFGKVYVVAEPGTGTGERIAFRRPRKLPHARRVSFGQKDHTRAVSRKGRDNTRAPSGEKMAPSGGKSLG